MTETAQSATVIGGGPAGLMAAEVLSAAGIAVDLYDAMPSVGRKFLLAGIGGMNITHSENFSDFLRRYQERSAEVGRLLAQFGPSELREWIHALGIETFVGSSGRVFPREMKAAPLLRAWLHRLREQGVRFHVRHRWQGWNDDGELVFETADGVIRRTAPVVVLALGGASWSRLGSDGAWRPWLQARGVDVAGFRPANCGFEVTWSDFFRERFAGEPVKHVTLSLTDRHGKKIERKGEFIVTREGIEGSLVYALSAALRDEVARKGALGIHLDLVPDRSFADVLSALGKSRGKRSLGEHLRRTLGIRGVKAALLREGDAIGNPDDISRLAARIKALPLRLERARPLDEAISTAGGIRFEALDEKMMLRALPGVFAAGEMLDWEAPTGGYLLTACFASGRAAGEGALARLKAGR